MILSRATNYVDDSVVCALATYTIAMSVSFLSFDEGKLIPHWHWAQQSIVNSWVWNLIEQVVIGMGLLHGYPKYPSLAFDC